MSSGISPEKLETWKKKRRTTFIAFVLVDVILGMEYSMILPTVYLYLTTLIKSSHPMLFYALIPASFYMANIFSGILMGRISDRSRKIWLLHQCGNLMILLGNLFYAFPFSSLFPLSGRILVGMGAGLRAVIYGEIGRVYEAKEVSRYIAITCIGCMVGYVLGPLVNVAFHDLDFKIGCWRINYTNMPGVYMAAICLINQIILLFTVHDLSAEYEYIYEAVETASLLDTTDFSDKRSSLLREDSLQNESAARTGCSSEISKEHEKVEQVSCSLPSQSFIWKKLLSSADWILLMTTTFVFGFTTLASDMWYPLIVVEQLKWGVTAINGVLIERGVIMLPLLGLLVLRPLSNRFVFISYIVTIIVQISIFFILLLLKELHSNYYFNISLLGLYGFCYSITGFMHQLPCMIISQMTPKSSQGYVQGIHQAYFRTGAALGLFIPPLVYTWLTIDVIVINILSAALLFALVARRQNIIEPKLLF